MYKLFQPITTEIIEHISQIIMNKEVNNAEKPLKFLFLVGGFAESSILQYIVRKTFTCQYDDKLLNDKIDTLLLASKSNKIQDQTKSNDKHQLTDQNENETIESQPIQKKSKNNLVLTLGKRSLNKLIKLDYQKSIKTNSSKEQSKSRSSAQNKLDSLDKLKDLDEVRKRCQFLKIIIPQEVSSAILKGAVLYGLNPNSITVRRSRLTYGIGILNRFQPDIHPKSKLIVRDNINWCMDLFDKFVKCNQVIGVNECVERRYRNFKKTF